MAFLVCTATRDEPVDWQRRVAYLDQSFYSWLVDACWRKPEFPRLSAIAALDYGAELAVEAESLVELGAELDVLASDSAIGGVHDLRQVCEQAVAAGVTCWFAGDMHPVLTRTDGPG